MRPGCPRHGIRKAVGVMTAQRGCTAQQIMETLGHDNPAEAERYIRKTDAIRLGNEGFRRTFGAEQAGNGVPPCPTGTR